MWIKVVDGEWDNAVVFDIAFNFQSALQPITSAGADTFGGLKRRPAMHITPDERVGRTWDEPICDWFLKCLP